MPVQLAIEFTDLEAKILHAVQNRGKWSVKAIAVLDLPRNENPEARIAERAALLRSALKDLKIKPQPAAVILPKHYVIVRLVTLPSTEESELAGMARFEAERHIPFNAERHIVSYHLVAKQGVQGSQVLLAAVDGPVADEHLDVCIKAGLTVHSIGVSGAGQFNALAAQKRSELAGRTVAIVSPGAITTDVSIVRDGQLIFVRSASLGLGKLAQEIRNALGTSHFGMKDLVQIDLLQPMNSFSALSPASDDASGFSFAAFSRVPDDAAEISATFPAVGPAGATDLQFEAPAEADQSPAAHACRALAQWLQKLAGEIKRTCEFAQREFACPVPEHLYLTGEGAALKNLPRFLTVNFGVDATTFDPLAGWELPAGAVLEPPRGHAAYAGAVGALFEDTGLSVHFNLLPPRYTAQRQTLRQRRSFITTGILVFVLLIAGYLYATVTFDRMEDSIREYRDANLDLRPLVADLEAKKMRLDIIRQFVSSQRGALEILEQISSFDLIPGRVTLTRYEFQRDDQVKITGHARTIADVNRLQSALENLNIFDTVQQDEGSNKPVTLANRTERVIEYSITSRLPRPRQPARATASGGGAARAPRAGDIDE